MAALATAEQGSGHQGLEAALLRLKPIFATESLAWLCINLLCASAYCCETQGGKKRGDFQGVVEASATTVMCFESH